MIQVYPLEIVKAAISLGYQEKDLYPMPQQQLQQQCNMITFKMLPKQKQFYLQRKMMIYEARRQKIIKEAQNQERILKNKMDKYNKYNPKVKQILQQHQKSLKKNQRYNEIRSRNSQRSNQNKKKFFSNTIDVNRESLNLNSRSYSRTSQASRSAKSRVSQRSNRTSSSANSLTRSRLQEVRQKQKQAQQLKKRMLQQKRRRDQIKFLKAEQNALNKSRKVKIRSQISQKVVKQNKMQIDFIRSLGMKDHLQNLKFKIAKKNYDKQKLLKSISQSDNKDIELYFVNHVHNRIQHAKDLKNKYRYQEKIKNSNDWQRHYNSMKKQSISFIQHQNELKSKLASERRSFHEREQKKFKEQVLLFQQKRISNAQKRRQQETSKRKLIGISQQIKRQIVDKNKKALQTSHSMRNKALTHHYNQKINLKNKLRTGELNLNRALERQNQNGGSKINAVRKSFTSGNNRHAYFNTILQ